MTSLNITNLQKCTVPIPRIIPCASKAKHIRNEAVDALEAGKVDLIAHRLNQSGNGLFLETVEGVLHGMGTTVLAYKTLGDPEAGVVLAGSVLLAALALHNRTLHKGTRDACLAGLLAGLRAAGASEDVIESATVLKRGSPSDLEQLHISTTAWRAKGPERRPVSDHLLLFFVLYVSCCFR
jgi:hypothetical protein